MNKLSIILAVGLILGLQFLVSYFNQNKELKIDVNNKESKIEQLQFQRDSLELILDSLPLGHPLDSIVISENFGVRKHPITKRWRLHCGLDLAGTYRDTIYATGSGRVIKAKRYRGYGRCVIIKHKGEYKSLYGHMNKIFVKWNDMVKDGDPIGTVGSTGFSTGTHLHYEIFRFDQYTNPEYYLNS